MFVVLRLATVVISLVLSFSDLAESLKDVKIVIPSATYAYKPLVIECQYDLEGAALGSVLFLKDQKDFYKYARRGHPQKQAFPLPGVDVDVTKSNKTHVVLTQLTAASSGQYLCFVETSGGGVQGAPSKPVKMTTVERQDGLLIGTRKGIFAIDTKNYSAATQWTDGNPVFSVGYQLDRKKIYYGATGGNIINQDFVLEKNQAKLTGALILSEEVQVTSITVDWLHSNLYFTDDDLDVVGMINLKTEERQELLDSSDGVKTPESIVVDPFQGYLFWGDNDDSEKKIVASGLDGKTNRKTIVNTSLRRAILALDLERRRLYYLSSEGLSSCKYDGSQPKLHFQHRALDSNLNSLSYHDGYIYWSKYDTGKSSSGLFYAPFLDANTPVKELPIKSILDVKVFNKKSQPSSIRYSCQLVECSHGCTVDDKGSAVCTCPDAHVLSAGNTVCIKESEMTNCEKSLTTVNSQPVCKGDMVFEDSFNSESLDVMKWKHTIQISSQNELEFVAFARDQTHTKDGNLIISPKIIPDDIVTRGNITLQGCTSSDPDLCRKEAYSYNIIPPVRSGLINTANSFRFRYGTITIRAKLPKGDWIFPVFNLQPAKNVDTPDYGSGVMRLPSVKGNQRLTCDGKEAGRKNVAAKVMIGQADNIKSLYVNKLGDEDWCNDFHTYKFIWTPDELSFSVDDGKKQSLLSEGQTLRSALKLSEDEIPSTWTQEKLSPLDQEHYLSIGVSVGGSLEFSDSCVSGRSAKPWRNFEVKALLKFWQKKGEWAPTWTQPDLLVDYINVRAL